MVIRITCVETTKRNLLAGMGGGDALILRRDIWAKVDEKERHWTKRLKLTVISDTPKRRGTAIGGEGSEIDDGGQQQVDGNKH